MYEGKVIDLKCIAKFDFRRDINNKKPELKMSVVNLVVNDYFKLDPSHCGRWYNDGPILQAIPSHITVRGSRFAFEGELHPSTYQGYKANINPENTEATFSLQAYVIDESSNDRDNYTPVVLRFVAEIPAYTLGQYTQAIADYENLANQNQIAIDDFMNFINQ